MANKWYVHPSPKLDANEPPKELVLTNGSGSVTIVYVPRKTCHMVLRDDLRGYAYQDTYECDVCGEQIERGTVMGKSEPPRFCCGCGAEVVLA